MKTMFRGIFLTSEMPERTATFYRDIAGIPLEMVGDQNTYAYWKHDKDGMQIAIHDARLFSSYTFPSRADSNVTHLYFKIQSIPLFLAHLERSGIAPASTDDVVVTVADPDGRMVMFGTA